jgi:RNA polymerase sigma-70 factor (ECF subfamily)
MPDALPNPPSEEDLLLAVGRGDRAAFAEVYTRIGPSVKGFLVQRTRDPVLAEEVLQDVMLTLWRRARSYDPARASARTWIFTITRNRMIDRIRRLGRPEPSPDDPNWVPAAPTAADDLVDQRERADRVLAAVQTLPAPQREVVQLTFYEARSYPEIADDLGIALGTVKSRARLAFRKLRDHLEKP